MTRIPMSVADENGQLAQPAALELRGITKRFGDFVANKDVSLRIEPGEIHAVVGENGAGKSTLMNICFGILQPTSGEIFVDGRRVTMTNPIVSRRHGVGMVHQHFKLVPSLTVAENVFLGAEPTKFGALDRVRMVSELKTVSDRFGLEVHPRRQVGQLSAGLRQRVEILKALHHDANVLILDEPTAVLTPQETDRLFAVLRRLAADGRSVILITHKLGEVTAVADRYSVMRQGELVATGSVPETTEREIAAKMVGRDISLARTTPAVRVRPDTAVVLRTQSLTVADAEGRALVNDVSIDLRLGEIVGIAGVEGNGQTELVEAIAGLRTLAGGVVIMGGRDVTGDSPAQRRAAGLAHVPEDRLASGVSPTGSVEENLAAGFPHSNLFRRGLLRRRSIRRWAADLIRRYDIRGADPTTPVGNLSGGNIQKVVLARELEARPRVLLAAQPTRGVDIGAMEFVHGRLRAERDDGAAVLLVSADLGELLAVCDRLLVIYRGRITAEFEPTEGAVARIGLAMTGTAGDEDRYEPPVAEATAPLVSFSSQLPTVLEPEMPAGKTPRDWRRLARDAAAAFSQPAVSVIIALAIGLIAIIGLGDDPVTSYRDFLLGSFQDSPNFSAMLVQATPLLLIAVSVYVSFRSGVFNVGGEGQMYVGALLGAYTALQLDGLPGPLLVVVSLLAGAAAGALWALLPALLDAYLGVDILVTTLMFSYIAMNLTDYLASGPLRDPTAVDTETRMIPSSAVLPKLFAVGGANVGTFVGLAALALVGVLVVRTRWGLQARMVGENRRFARCLGVNVRLMIVQVVLISGAVAGVGGVVESLGTQLRFNQSFSPGFGFLGLTVAVLGRLSPAGILVAAGLYASFEQGATVMQLDTGVPLSFVNVLEGVIILLATTTAIGWRRGGRVPSVMSAALSNQSESR